MGAFSFFLSVDLMRKLRPNGKERKKLTMSNVQNSKRLSLNSLSFNNSNQYSKSQNQRL